MSEPKIQPAGHGDFRYYRRMFNFGFVWNLAHAPRRRMYDFFLKSLSPREDETVLDLGSSNLAEPLENIFELYYPHKNRITAAGVEDCSFLEKTYPGLRFVRLKTGEPLPFPDDAFDVGFSNAVIEHVGSRENQALFLNELIRVSRRCFVSTPNRWFPFELHTRLPFVHWLPAPLFRRVIAALGLDFYAREENLNLLSAGDLRRMLGSRPDLKTTLARNYFFGLPSNLMLVIEKAPRALT
jgi:SAM-dependent methyltransferase